MTPTLRSSNNDTRESALAKAGAWYDSIGDGKIAKFATAIGQADDVSCEDMIAAIDQGRLMAVQGRAPFLADVARVLDEVIATRRGDQRHA
jgi:hypothetical protein